MKKTVDADIVEMFVNGVLHSLDLLESHLKGNNLLGIEKELTNAKGELHALLRDLEKLDSTYRIHEYHDTGRESTDEPKPDQP